MQLKFLSPSDEGAVLKKGLFSLFICVYVHEHTGACRDQKEATDSLKLELWVIVNLLMWVLGTELCSSASLLTAEPSLQTWKWPF